jgi:hypothetical protein
MFGTRSVQTAYQLGADGTRNEIKRADPSRNMGTRRKLLEHSVVGSLIFYLSITLYA